MYTGPCILGQAGFQAGRILRTIAGAEARNLPKGIFFMESHFQPFRENIIGIDQTFQSPFGTQKIVYADWIASGRLYGPIEQTLVDQVGPFVGNTHTEITVTGSAMTRAYQQAHEIIKQHVPELEKSSIQQPVSNGSLTWLTPE